MEKIYCKDCQFYDIVYYSTFSFRGKSICNVQQNKVRYIDFDDNWYKPPKQVYRTSPKILNKDNNCRYFKWLDKSAWWPRIKRRLFHILFDMD
jgi:hypothetical protein